MKALLRFLATGFGSGYSPVAPGTVGTLTGFGVYALLSHLPWGMYAIICLLSLLFAVWVSTKTAPHFSNEDPSQIVIDEIVGVLFAMAFFPLDPILLIIGFLLFRIFDITKPYPSGWAEKHLPKGWGIVMDDVFAGIYANLVIRVLLYLGL